MAITMANKMDEPLLISLSSRRYTAASFKQNSMFE
jgi:hypothetical protein